MSYAKLGMAAFGAAAAYGLSRGRGQSARGRRSSYTVDTAGSVDYAGHDRNAPGTYRVEFWDGTEIFVVSSYTEAVDRGDAVETAVGVWEERVVPNLEGAPAGWEPSEKDVTSVTKVGGSSARGRRAVKAGQKFVIVDVSVPGGRWIDNIIYDSSSEADRAAAKMRTPWWKARRVQVIDAVWYGPAEARLQATGMRASRGRRAHPIYEHTTSLHHTPAFYLADQLLQGTTPPKGRTWETPQERTLRRLYMAKEEAHRSTSDMRGGSEIPDELWEQAEREIDRRIARVSLAIGKMERKGTNISGRGRRAAPLTAGTMSMFKAYRFKVRPVKGADNTLERRFTLKAMPGGWLFQRKGYGVKRLNKGKADVLIEASDFLGRER